MDPVIVLLLYPVAIGLLARYWRNRSPFQWWAFALLSELAVLFVAPSIASGPQPMSMDSFGGLLLGMYGGLIVCTVAVLWILPKKEKPAPKGEPA